VTGDGACQAPAAGLACAPDEPACVLRGPGRPSGWVGAAGVPT